MNIDKLNTLDQAIKRLINNEFNDENTFEFIKSFIDYQSEKSKKVLIKLIDGFIYSGLERNVFQGENFQSLNFGPIFKVEEFEKEPGCSSGVFYNYALSVLEELMNVIRNPKLSSAFIKAGIIVPGLSEYNFEKIPGFVDLFQIERYTDLCSLSPKGIDEDIYIMHSDLIELLTQEGLDSNDYEIVFGKYGDGPRYPQKIKNQGLYFNISNIASKAIVDNNINRR